jgi:hypothetical protein
MLALAGATLAGTLFALVCAVMMHDMDADMATMMADICMRPKLVVTTAISVSGVLLLQGVARPAWTSATVQHALAMVPAALVLIGLSDIGSPAAQCLIAPLDAGAASCLLYIPLIAIPPLGCLLLALRNGAPADPRRAGACAGLVAGSIAANVFALTVGHSDPLILATLYPIAIGLIGCSGWVIGGRTLRW